MQEVQYEVLFGELYVGCLDAWVDVEVAPDAYGNPTCTVIGVYSETDTDRQINLLQVDDENIAAMARWIAAKAEADETVIDEAIEASGVSWTGNGPNDPDGRFVWGRY